MLNVWFYTLSSTSQVLAAIVGIFAVLVVYKLQGLKPFLQEARFALIKIIPYISRNLKKESDARKKICYSEIELEICSYEEICEKFEILLSELKRDGNQFEVKTHPVKSSLFSEKFYDINDDTMRFFRTLVGQQKEIFARLKVTTFLGFILITFGLFGIVLTDYIADLKTLVLSIIAVVFYFVYISINIYKISLVQ